MATATFHLFFRASASQASRIFFTSVKDRHGLVRMITPGEICFTVLMANGLTVGVPRP
jgi:hypothetical protein